MQLTDKDVKFFSSGSTLLDLALNGGWTVPRVFNIVGDKSVGKTLMGIEAFANFKQTFGAKARMKYVEAESAFDETYAEVLGFPPEVERSFAEINTVSEFEDDFLKFIRQSSDPGIYILDSLDALNSDVEAENIELRAEGKKEKGSFGAEKAKDMSALFRHLCREMKHKNVCLGIISQIRENVGVMFGETKTRSGGKALDFYCTHVVWLSQTGKIERTALGMKRAVGVKVKAQVKKNKVGFPFREAEWPLIFSYGVDDEVSMLEWMKANKQITEESYKIMSKQLDTARENRDYNTLFDFKKTLKADVTRIWKQVEDALAPTVRKYEQVPAPMPTTPPPPPLKALAEQAKQAIDNAVTLIDEKKEALRVNFSINNVQTTEVPNTVSPQKDDVPSNN